MGDECMNDFQLRCFMTAASCLSFTKAAELMNLTQPAFTHNISALEEELNLRLFVRDKRRGTSLTPAGKVLAARLPQLHEALDDALNEAAQANGGGRGSLTCCFLDGHWIDARTRHRVRAFREAYPEVHMTVKKRVNAEQIDGLVNGRYDLVWGMAFDFEHLPGIAWRVVCHAPHYLLLPPDYPVEDGATYPISRFQNETIIVPHEADSEDILTLHYKRMMEQENVEVKNIHVSDHRDQIALLELGFGITGGDPDSVYFHVAPFKKVRLRDAPDVVTVMAWRTENRNPCLAKFRDFYFQEE